MEPQDYRDLEIIQDDLKFLLGGFDFMEATDNAGVSQYIAVWHGDMNGDGIPRPDAIKGHGESKVAAVHCWIVRKATQ